MPQIGPLEILVVAAVALIVFGPEKLPEMARTVGRTIADIRRMADDIRSDFRDEPVDDVPEAEPEPRADHPAALASTSKLVGPDGAPEPAGAGEAGPEDGVASQPEGARTREA